MNRRLALLVVLLCAACSVFGGVTSTLLKTRRAASASIVPGYWHANFSKAKNYALSKGIPFVAVWSNGDACGHCVAFESSCNSSYFKNWMKTSGIVFYFIYSGDAGDGEPGSSVFHWIRKNTNTSYPFVRIYWPKGNVDVATIGDTVDGNRDGTTGGKKVVAYLKNKLAKFKPTTTTIVKPYTVVFNPNGGTGEIADKRTKVGTTFTLPANTFKRADCSFSGWAKTATGAVAYKDKASVKNLTTVSNGVVNLYARWCRITYRTYYVGLKSTITMSSALKGYTTSSKVPGLKWSSSTYKWTGTPTKAGTYTIKFQKGSKTATRKIVIAKDAIVWADGAFGRLFPDGEIIDLDLSPTSAVGTPKSIVVTGLPEGISYADGHLTGASTKAGTFRLTVTMVSAAGQKLARAYDLNIGVPACCIGTFNGFVGFATTNTTDELALSNRGTFRLSAPSNAALSAKVVTAKGTYSFTGVGWMINGDGTYTAELKTSTGKDVLTVTSGTNLPPYESIREIGLFTPSYGTSYEIWAQRAPFARNDDGTYVDPIIDAAMKRVVGTWYFKAYAVGSQWVLLYASASSAGVTLTVAADGTAKFAGKIGSYAVSASSSVFIFAGDLEMGCVRADFPMPVTVSNTKKTLDIWTNLWFDRSNDHFNTRGEGVGGASIETFK